MNWQVMSRHCSNERRSRKRISQDKLGRPAIFVEDQQATAAFLLDPSSYGATGPVEDIETHISRLFLVGQRAYKMKRAVKLPYVDFSTPALRLAACEKEVELNSKTAPGLYLGVRRISRQADGKLVFDGTGQMVDAAIEMVRFDESKLLDRMATAGELTPELMTRVARMIAGYHRSAPTIHNGSGSSNLAGVLDINEAGFATSHVFAKQRSRALPRPSARPSTGIRNCSTAGKPRARSADAMAICICATSAFSMASPASSIASNSTTRSPASTFCTTLPSC